MIALAAPVFGMENLSLPLKMRLAVGNATLSALTCQEA